MTRRDFIAGATAMAAGLALPGGAGAVKSAVAARHILGGGGWKNPYITNGLVAMWDGEWNAGGGVHDATATTWKDLVGNRDWTLGPVSSYEWTADSFYAKDQYSATQDFIDGALVQTIEFCVSIKTQSATLSGNYAFIILGRTSSSILSSQPYYGLLFRNGYSFEKALMGCRSFFHDSYTEFADKRASISFPDYGIFNIDGFFNGSKRSANGSNTLDYNATTRGTVARIGGTMAQGMPLEVFNMRLYSRALTAEEVAHNYAVDKSRFNLP